MPLTPMLKPRRLAVGDLKIKLLLYGEPGAGKTTFAAQAGDHEKLAPVLFLNFEGGLLSVVERGDIDAVDINTIEELESVYEALRSNHPDYSKYNTIVIDSASELYSQALVEATQIGIEREARRGKVNDRTADDTELSDYGRAGKQVFRIFRGFRDLPLNIIAISTAKFTYPRNADKTTTDPISVTPQFSGQLATQMLGLFDFVHYLYTGPNDDESLGEVGEVFRYILTQNAGAYKAKTRGFTFAESLGEVVVNPYLPDIYDLLLRTGDSDARPEVRQMGSTHLSMPEPEPEPITVEPPTEEAAQTDTYAGRVIYFSEETSQWHFFEDNSIVPDISEDEYLSQQAEPGMETQEGEVLPEPPAKKTLTVTRAPKGVVEVPV